MEKHLIWAAGAGLALAALVTIGVHISDARSAAAKKQPVKVARVAPAHQRTHRVRLHGRWTTVAVKESTANAAQAAGDDANAQVAAVESVYRMQQAADAAAKAEAAAALDARLKAEKAGRRVKSAETHVAEAEQPEEAPEPSAEERPEDRAKAARRAKQAQMQVIWEAQQAQRAAWNAGVMGSARHAGQGNIGVDMYRDPQTGAYIRHPTAHTFTIDP